MQSWGSLYDQVAKDICKENYEQFVKEFWGEIIPETLVWNWHMSFVCEELQKVVENVIADRPKEYDLIINVPPGSSKPVDEEMDILMGNGTYKKLKDVRVGDSVIGKSGKPCKVLAVHKQGELECLRIGTRNDFLQCAYDHLVLTSYGWEEARNIEKGNLLTSFRKGKMDYRSVHSIEEVGLKPCRCLTVENDQSFVANDIVVHNSTLASIMLSPWAWIRKPSLRFICSSYAYPLSLALSTRCRDLLMSKRYQDYYGKAVCIREDQNQKGFYKTTFGGERYSTSTGGSVTGMHGHILVIDDPINPEEAASETQLRLANDWLDRTFLTRKIDKSKTPYILIMQRLHELDCTGHFLEKGGKIKHICLPAEVAPNISPPELKERYTDGLLDPERMPLEVLNTIRINEVGEYGYAGQFLQNPHPFGSGMFKTDKIEVVEFIPAKIKQSVRYWDKAGTAGAGCYTVGTLMHKLMNNKYVVADIKRGQWSSEVREGIIKQTAMNDGINVEVVVEQEPGSGGKESAESTIRNLAGFKVRADAVKGNKELRADPFASQVNAGNVMMVKASWNREFILELSSFPVGRFKDQCDSAGGAFASLHKMKKAGTWSSVVKK